MPHNPRRPRGPESTEIELTTERIADALARAVALRRRTAVDPDGVRAVAMVVSDAARSTKQRRAPVPWDQPEVRNPWVLVGWVRHEHDRGAADERWWDRFDLTWDVWLNVDDGRVWLKLSRSGRGAKDDPYP